MRDMFEKMVEQVGGEEHGAVHGAIQNLQQSAQDLDSIMWGPRAKSDAEIGTHVKAARELIDRAVSRLSTVMTRLNRMPS